MKLQERIKQSELITESNDNEINELSLVHAPFNIREC